MRDVVLQRLEVDLIGPNSIDEVLESRPSDVYLTGILWPKEERFDAQDDDDSDFDVDENDNHSAAGLAGQQKPCSMGLSFAVSSDAKSINVSVDLASYLPETTSESNERRKKTCWIRAQNPTQIISVPLDSVGIIERRVLTETNSSLNISLKVRRIKIVEGWLCTATLVNESKITDSSTRDDREQIVLFQTKLTVHPDKPEYLIPRPDKMRTDDLDAQSSSLLYSWSKQYATGHQCSAMWPDDGEVDYIYTSWLPHAFVPAFKDTGSEEFSELVQSGKLSAKNLSEATDAQIIENLKSLVTNYRNWIDLTKEQIASLDARHHQTAQRHIEACEIAIERMDRSIEALKGSKEIFMAFRLANAAMHLQHSWKVDSNDVPLPELVWRPFQIGFILLALESTCNPVSAERETLDLLWFPTGGGKTEAYLTLIAISAWHRRLIRSEESELGCSAFMRYTLRLLTAQQFERAGAMILACELLRKQKILQNVSISPARFSIGLWVGQDSTPNKFSEAMNFKTGTASSSPEMVVECYSCKNDLIWKYDEQLQSVYPICKDDRCVLGQQFGPWPIYTVDEDLYRIQPTLVIATVDKFAQIPFKKEINQLFGFRTAFRPDLIIQDELHLISGPLGTLVGLYETALDWLLTYDGNRPKILGSTATIRRAPEQVRALFNRDSFQFPPPGLSSKNSGFAVIDDAKPGRLYVGVTTAGRSAKFTLQAAGGSLMQSGGDTTGREDDERDGYSTLLLYFNSLRELGGAIVQVLDDIPDSIDMYANRRGEEPRVIDSPQELTSRVNQVQITQILSDLQLPCSDSSSVDAVLATNMVSVGVDVPRLALMLVNGQPKTRSEYIQSTSRVGRSKTPGLVVTIMNSSKPRDRSHFETYFSWHATLYKDVEATSVTPFAPRARDRALRTVLVSMIRHGSEKYLLRPSLPSDLDKTFIDEIIHEILERVGAISPDEKTIVENEINTALNDWQNRAPSYYHWPQKLQRSLMQKAEVYAQRIAMFRIPFPAWPTLNTMRTVEPSTRFRMAEVLRRRGDGQVQASDSGADGNNSVTDRVVPDWRRRRD